MRARPPEQTNKRMSEINQKPPFLHTGQIKCLSALTFALWFSLPIASTQASIIQWQGHTWTLKSDQASGPGPNNWNPKNIFVDTKGCLHLQITSDPASPNGFDCAELVTTDKLGFGTYQWQIQTRVDVFDPWVVLGLFPYGPPDLGPDGSNEIDIEYSRWGRSTGTAGGFTIYPNVGTVMTTHQFAFHLESTETTSRFTWDSKGIHFWLMADLQPVEKTQNVLATWDYTPTNYLDAIPQNAMPLHINLWLDRGHAPANGQPVEVIIRSFTKI